MMSIPRNKYLRLLLYTLLVCLSVTSTLQAQNGMFYDDHHNFLIPLMENNTLRGHIYVHELDKISRDTTKYLVEVYDEFLRDVGEKALNLDAKYRFEAAVFNGSHIVLKFSRKQEAVRYIVLDQQANVFWDTTMQVPLREPDEKNAEDIQPTPMLAVAHYGVYDYLPVTLHGRKAVLLVFIGNEQHIWTHAVEAAYPVNVIPLAADDQYLVQAVYTYKPRGHYNDVITSVQILTAQGQTVGEHLLFRDDSVCIYPVAAEIQKSGIEIFSEFTSRAHEYSKVKFGACVHRVNFTGQALSAYYNDFTQNLSKDTAMKKYKLLQHSYLYMHKAIKLRNGNWLVAAEQFQRTRLRMMLFRKPFIVYNKKNICLMELDDHAVLDQIHVEANKPDGVRLPAKYYRRPQNGAQVVLGRGRMDISYFIEHQESEEAYSFIYTDYNYLTRKVALGNMLYRGGKISVDRFNIPTFSAYTRMGILPARYGHVLLIRYDPRLGLFDFENIKFNN